MTSGPRMRLGDWTCPSGNNVEVFYRPVGDGFAMLDMQWDSPPPLRAADDLYYITTIRPAVMARAREYTETMGTTLLVAP